MYIGMRWMTTTSPKGVEMASGIATHLRDNQGWNVVAGTSLVGPSGRVGLMSLHDSLSQLLDRRTAVLSDPGIAAMASDLSEAFIPGSATDYILRVEHGDPSGGEGDLLFFRAVATNGAPTADYIAGAVQMAEHMKNVHGIDATIASAMGGDTQGLLYAVRMSNGDELEAMSDAIAADELMMKMAADRQDQTAGVSDRIIRMLA